MSVRSTEGELLAVRVSVEPRRLEALLEVLAGLPFPVNPELFHEEVARVAVEFPAFDSRVEHVRMALEQAGFAGVGIQLREVLVPAGR